MKTIQLRLTALVSFFFLITLLSCSDEADYAVTPKISKVESIVDPSEQKTAFLETLSNDEKLLIFKRRIERKLTAVSLNAEQKQHLQRLIDNVTVDIYDRSSEHRNEQLNFLKQWTEEGKIVFGNDLLFDLVGSLTSDQAKAQLEANAKRLAGARPAANCNCSYASNYCSGNASCSTLASCNGSGCGTLWLYTCDGACSLPSFRGQL